MGRNQVRGLWESIKKIRKDFKALKKEKPCKKLTKECN